MTHMQIHVAGVTPVLTDQVRAYAEYRVFSRLSPLARGVDVVQVIVQESDDDGGAICAISADLGEAGCVRARVRRPHPIGAIDAAADHLARIARRRLRRPQAPQPEAARSA
jgi:ribosome-associated translation inhibitor RaiA